MPYSKAATKAMNAMKKEYGSNWKSVYYALASKRAGKGLKGAHRGHRAANQAFAKGSHWGGRGKRRSSGTRSRSRGVSINRRHGNARVRIRIH